MAFRSLFIVVFTILFTDLCVLYAQGTEIAFEKYELALEQPHDLLAMVRLPNHSLRGTWKQQGDALVCEPSDDAQLMLPVAVSGSYEIDCEFTRRSGEETIAVVLPVGTSPTAILLSGWAGAASGIAAVDGRDARSTNFATGAAVRPGKLINGQRYRLQVEVILLRQRAMITAALNGQRFVMWKGLSGQLGYWSQYSIPCQQSFALIGHRCAADFHKCELTIKKGSSGYRLDDASKSDWRNPLIPVANGPPKKIIGQCTTWNGHKYFMTDKPVDIVTARRLATELQGRLLTISSKEEEDFFFKEGRGVEIWLSGWRSSARQGWYDERNRPLKYVGKWAPRNPSQRYWESLLVLHTKTNAWIGWHDHYVTDRAHACIEWGEEYTEVTQ